MRSHVLRCVSELCLYSVHFFLCEVTDMVKDGWLDRLNTWPWMHQGSRAEHWFSRDGVGSEHLSKGTPNTAMTLVVSPLCLTSGWAPSSPSAWVFQTQFVYKATVRDIKDSVDSTIHRVPRNVEVYCAKCKERNQRKKLKPTFQK